MEVEQLEQQLRRLLDERTTRYAGELQVIVSAMQERIETLEARITALEGKPDVREGDRVRRGHARLRHVP